MIPVATLATINIGEIHVGDKTIWGESKQPMFWSKWPMVLVKVADGFFEFKVADVFKKLKSMKKLG